MNKKEEQIISHLRKNAKASVLSLSRQIEMPLSTIYDKINRLNQSKVIKKIYYFARLR
jgi:DNA-binding Lrp family transcriptional regulator